MSIKRFLGLDVGEVRIGVAAGDNDVKIAFPLAVIENDETAISKIAEIADAERAELLVIGLPRNARGEETAQSAFSRTFADKLKHSGLKTVFQDESLTSILAEDRLNAKKTKKLPQKGDIDKEAATIILQDYLERTNI